VRKLDEVAAVERQLADFAGVDGRRQRWQSRFGARRQRRERERFRFLRQWFSSGKFMLLPNPESHLLCGFTEPRTSSGVISSLVLSVEQIVPRLSTVGCALPPMYVVTTAVLLLKLWKHEPSYRAERLSPTWLRSRLSFFPCSHCFRGRGNPDLNLNVYADCRSEGDTGPSRGNCLRVTQ
jgi:hypothetical protein